MKKIVEYSLIILALFIAIIFYFSFDLENILWNNYERASISNEKIKEDMSKDYTGLKPEEDIMLIKSKEEWDKVLNEIDYVSVVPKSIIKTNVYSLAKWVGSYTKKTNGTSGRKLEEAKKSSLDISSNYTPYYIIELEDGSHILAQMNRGIADEIEKGESIKLPLGKKLGFSKKAKNLLKSICEEWEVNTDYVLYTIDNNWEADNANKILIEKFIISFVLFFILAIILLLCTEKFLFKEENDYNSQ